MQAERLVNSNNTNAILSSSAAALHEPITNLFTDPQVSAYRRMITIISFLVFLGEPAMPVERLLNGPV